MDLALGQTPRLRLGNQAAHIPDDFVNLHKSALRQAREDPVRTPLPSPTVSGSGPALRAPAPIPLANWVWTQCSHDCRSAEAFRMSGRRARSGGLRHAECFRTPVHPLRGYPAPPLGERDGPILALHPPL